jgi:hypothetical protein
MSLSEPQDAQTDGTFTFKVNVDLRFKKPRNFSTERGVKVAEEEARQTLIDILEGQVVHVKKGVTAKFDVWRGDA